MEAGEWPPFPVWPKTRPGPVKPGQHSRADARYAIILGSVRHYQAYNWQETRLETSLVRKIIIWNQMINISVRRHQLFYTCSGRMDVYYAQKIAKCVQNPEVDVRIRPNFEARRKHTSKLLMCAYTLITGELRKDTNFRKLVSSLSWDMTAYDVTLMSQFHNNKPVGDWFARRKHVGQLIMVICQHGGKMRTGSASLVRSLPLCRSASPQSAFTPGRNRRMSITPTLTQNTEHANFKLTENTNSHTVKSVRML